MILLTGRQLLLPKGMLPLPDSSNKTNGAHRTAAGVNCRQCRFIEGQILATKSIKKAAEKNLNRLCL